MIAKNERLGARVQKTEFQLCLFDLLDNTQIMTRKKWSDELGVTQSAISQWVQGITVPRAPVLHRLWERVLAEHGDRLLPIIQRFNAMAEMPAQLVSRHSRRLGPSIKSYVMRPAFEQFWRFLQELSLLEQARVLREARRLTVESSTKTGEEEDSLSSAQPPWQTAPAIASNTSAITDRLKNRAVEIVEQLHQRCGGQLDNIEAEVVKRLRTEDQSIVNHMQELRDWLLQYFLSGPFIVEVQIEKEWTPIAGEEPLKKHKFDEILQSARRQIVRVRAISGPEHSQANAASSTLQHR